MILDNLDLVRKIARNAAKNINGDPEEFEADGMVGLVQAAQRYDPAKNKNFVAYAKRRIYGAIIDGYREVDILSRGERERRKKDPNHVKRSKYPSERVDPVVLDYLIGDSADQIAALEKRYLHDMLKILPFKLKQILHMYYLEQKSYTEIGKIFGLTVSRICQLQKQALELIRADLKKKGYF